MNKLSDEQINHVNDILIKLKKCWDTQGGSQIDFSLYYSEITKVYKGSRIDILRSTINTFLSKGMTVNNDEFITLYNHISSMVTKDKFQFNFLIPLTHLVDLDIDFNGCHIKTLNETQKVEIFRQLTIHSNNGFQFIKKLDFTTNNIYLFSFLTNNEDEGKSKILSTFQFYKGLLEFSYNRFRWNVYQQDYYSNTKGQSSFKYPLFFYVKLENSFLDLIENEDLPYDYMNKKNQENQGNLLYFKDQITLLNNNILDTEIRKIFINSFTLYGQGMDTKYVDQSFLFFWNILEQISLINYGKTERVLKRILNFCSVEFLKDNINNIESLKKIRNDKVHEGIKVMTMLDLNILKYLVDNSIFHILENYTSGKNRDDLELFYKSKGS